MINSQEFISLIDARCNLATRASKEYREVEEKLGAILSKIDKKSADLIDGLMAEQQAIVEELVYKQGMKDALSLLK